MNREVIQGARFTAPAAIQLAANAADANGTIAKVDFYQNGALIGTATVAPYTFNWSSVPAGTYTLTAVATNDAGMTTTSAPVTVNVASARAAVYYIHSDQLNTPRVITDQSQRVVWRWDNTDPFGANVPDENPSGLGRFEFNLRFPGQYFDKETNLHYNYFRDCYDPLTGRYCQSDPIGLRGGLNLYAYVGGNPISRTDPDGLCPQGDVMCEIANRQAGLPPDPPPRGPLKPSCFAACLAVKPAIGQAGTVAAGKVGAAAAQSTSAILRGAGVVVTKGAQALSTPIGITISVAAAVDYCLKLCSPIPEDPNSCNASAQGSIGSITAP